MCESVISGDLWNPKNRLSKQVAECSLRESSRNVLRKEKKLAFLN